MARQIHEYHPTIGYTFIPGLRARIPHEAGGYTVKTNGAGFRCDHEVTPEKPADTFRIALFGDSFTAGDGVNNRQRFGDLLEQRFPGTQVLNFGLSGTGTDQQYLIFQQYAKNIEFDLMMICPLVENIRRVAARYRLVTSREDGEDGYLAKPYFELTDGKLTLRQVPVPKGTFSQDQLPEEDQDFLDVGGPHQLAREIVNTYLKPLKSVIQSATKFQPVPAYDDPQNPDWQLMKAILTQWTSEAGGKPVLVAPIPLYHHIEQSAPADGFVQRFKELDELPNVKTLNSLPRFWQESAKTRKACRFKTDPHFTPLGHEVFADALYPAISQYIESAN
ncbi:MAG: SGNH/GDSL hydrolase family protein [SAR202 cluster bacterium]|nr:SGNH/GDSL hydrolase family protein [SAR202 cluster bacterium]MDP6511560.1 SGNH/GDSL hydrolase family protein [SAR202 cluster bacterium]